MTKANFFFLLLMILGYTEANLSKSLLIPKKGDSDNRLGLSYFSAMKPKLTREERFDQSISKFEQAIMDIGSELPNRGSNLANISVIANTSEAILEVLEKRGSKGIVLRIENFSNRYLGDPQAFVRCGYQDKEFGTIHMISPGTIEIALLHNYREFRSSCGVVSWQVMVHPGKPYRLHNKKGLRLYVTWSSLDTVGRNRCSNGKNNEFVVGFVSVDLDQSGHSVFDLDDLYKNYHTEDYIKYYSFPMDNATLAESDKPSVATLTESPDGLLEVRGELESGCSATLTLQVLGKHSAKIARSDLGLEEPFKPDHVWEQMIRQAWKDIVRTINRDKALYNISLNPLNVDSMASAPIYINTSVLGYEVEFWMWNVTVDGLANIRLEKLDMKRGDALTNLKTVSTLNMGNITVSGMYRYKAIYTGWVWGMSDMDSEGDQPFRVDMNQAKFNIEVEMETVDGCGRTKDLIISDISLPVEYDEVIFDFTNIGAVLGGVIGIVGELAIQMSKETVVDLIKTTMKKEVSTIICDKFNVADNERIAVVDDPNRHSKWNEVLLNATRGWGLNTLRRDQLAEQFVIKLFNDGVKRHLSDPNDPIVKLLDPFQLLPVSEDFRQPGLVKGHAVVCELYLFGLSGIQLLDARLVRNEDLTYSGYWVRLGLPTTSIHGSYRLNNVRVMSVIPAPNSEGNITISLTNVTVDLMVVLRANTVRDLNANANITKELFAVDFGHETVQFKINGLAKGLNTVSNKLTNLLGSKLLKMQKELLNKEIYNIINGFAECIMYKPGQSLTYCMDRFWESLGYKVPFEFPSCQELYAIADTKKVVDGN